MGNTRLNLIPQWLAEEIIGWQEEKNEEYNTLKLQKLADKILAELINLIPRPNEFVTYFQAIEDFIEANNLETPLEMVMRRTSSDVQNNSFHLTHKIAERGTLEEFEYCVKYKADLNVKSTLRRYGVEQQNETVAVCAMKNNKIAILKKIQACGIDLHSSVIQALVDGPMYNAYLNYFRQLYYPLEIYNMSRETMEVVIELDTIKTIPRLSKILRLQETLWFSSYAYFRKNQIETAIVVLEHYGLRNDETDWMRILSTLDNQINLINKLPDPNLIFAVLGDRGLFEQGKDRFRTFQPTLGEIFYLKGLITTLILENREYYSYLIDVLSLTTKKARTYFTDAAGNGNASACLRMGDLLWQTEDDNEKTKALDWYQLAIEASGNSVLKAFGIKKTIDFLKKLPRTHAVYASCLARVVENLQRDCKYLSARQLKEFAFILLQARQDADSELRSRLAIELACNAFYEATTLENEKMVVETGLCIETCFKTFLRDIQMKYPEADGVLSKMNIVVGEDNHELQINPCIYRICLCLSDIYAGDNKAVSWYQFIANLLGTLDYIPQLLRLHYKTPVLLSQDEKDSIIPAQNFLRFTTNANNQIQFPKAEKHKIKNAKVWLNEPVEDEEKESKETSARETLTTRDLSLVGTVKEYVTKLNATRAGLFLHEIRKIPVPDVVISLEVARHNL